MGHPDLIDVRETHGKTDRDVPVLIHCMYFISQIPCRLLYLQQKFIRQSKFSHKISIPFNLQDIGDISECPGPHSGTLRSVPGVP